jgi:hypothetical protein
MMIDEIAFPPAGRAEILKGVPRVAVQLTEIPRRET